ncbi:hypothetical protein EYC80_004356 [Monilinia laxa]|uniref:Uncharacterized protein n=1 Tax=Monilinia laxa TaxID=61186 RepID=A0A5N6KMI5_MONLA|nr:hypothetical protein EYC80_004356 [Monilinia laxa]
MINPKASYDYPILSTHSDYLTIHLTISIQQAENNIIIQSITLNTNIYSAYTYADTAMHHMFLSICFFSAFFFLHSLNPLHPALKSIANVDFPK